MTERVSMAGHTRAAYCALKGVQSISELSEGKLKIQFYCTKFLNKV